MSSQHTQLLIIGAGPGGYSAAFYAADQGLEVTLVDPKNNPGGVCLFSGCIPSKAYLHAAKLISEAKEATELGLDFGTPQIDIARLRSWKNDVVTRLTSGLGQLSQQRKINFIQGQAVFLNSQSVQIQPTTGDSMELTFDQTIVATGSVPMTLPFAPASPRILNSTSALALKDVPQRLLIIGGGYIGLELGTVYHELGSEISVVEMTPTLLAEVDRDLTMTLSKRLKTKFKDIKLNTKVVNLEDTDTAVKVSFSDANKTITNEEYDKVLIAIGRKPSTSNLGLDKTKITLTEDGFISINPQRQTEDPAIYAIGDISGQPLLAHKAAHEGRVTVEAILGKKTVFEPKAIPAVVFTDPEIAWCGLTETQAKAEGRAITISKFPWAASGRAITLNRTDGLTKLVTDPESGRILGVAIVGVNAGEMISEGVLAVEMGATAEDVALSIHPHPTLSETIMEAAEGVFGQSTHIYRMKKEVRIPK